MLKFSFTVFITATYDTVDSYRSTKIYSLLLASSTYYTYNHKRTTMEV